MKINTLNPSLKIKELLYNENDDNYSLINIINEPIIIDLNFDNSIIAFIEIDILKISNTKFAIFNYLNKLFYLKLIRIFV